MPIADAEASGRRKRPTEKAVDASASQSARRLSASARLQSSNTRATSADS
jgi:galactose-1-phosphate uridylyltransferase